MWQLLGLLADFLGSTPPWRVTVADRYEMKRKVRELRERERRIQAAEAKRDRSE